MTAAGRESAPGPRTGEIPVKAVAHYQGTPAVGLRVTLSGSGSVGSNLHYKWIQTQGTPVSLETASESLARFTVPAASGPLGFLLIAGDESGFDVAGVTVPVQGGTAADGAGLRADAGDDQIATVGRQVTLNGVRSEPKGAIAYRWIQVAGPAVALKIEDRYVFTFVPQDPGYYRFALVVAAEGAISQPDMVDVIVGGANPAAGPAHLTRISGRSRD